MIIGTLTLLSILFLGGGYQGAFFELPEVQKIIKQEIVDEERNKQALFIADTYFTKVKIQRKKGNSIVKEIGSISKDRLTSREKFESNIQELKDIDLYLQKEWIEMIGNVKQYITEEEFKNIIEIGLSKKDEKASLQDKNKRETYLKEIEDQIDKIVIDENKRKEAIQYYNAFHNSLNELYGQQDDLQFNSNLVLNDYNSMPDDYREAFDAYNIQNNLVLDTYVDVHFKLAQILTDQEWKKLVKTSKKILR